MKKISLSVLAVVVAAAFFFSCNKGGSPKAVANTWLTAFYHMDYEAAKKVSTDETKNLLTQLAQFSGMVPDSTKQQYKKITVEVKDVKENGDKADVTYLLNDPTSKDASNKEQILHLVKQDNKWLVQFSKNDSMGGDDGKDGGDKSMGADSTAPAQNPPADNPPADAPAPDKK